MKKTVFSLLAGCILASSAWAQLSLPEGAASAAKQAAATAETAKKAKAKADEVAPGATDAVAKKVKEKVSPAPAETKPAAATGDKVWVNDKVYHCPGSRFYGKTKKGEYMSEADAKTKGAKIAKGKGQPTACF